MTVVDILKEQDNVSSHRLSFILMPKLWQEYRVSHNWVMHPCNQAQKSLIPDIPGIYTLLVQPGIASHPSCSYLMYVGKATSLKRRFGEYFSERKRATGRPNIIFLFNKFENNLWFCYTTINKDQLSSVENALIDAYMPPLNDQIQAKAKKGIRAF
jgi:excinuclease UvrABC nuclease subunit